MFWRKLRKQEKRSASVETLEHLGAMDKDVLAKIDIARLLLKIPNTRQRAVLYLKFIEGCPPGEIAERLGYAPESLRTITNRSLKLLYKILTQKTP